MLKFNNIYLLVITATKQNKGEYLHVGDNNNKGQKNIYLLVITPTMAKILACLNLTIFYVLVITPTRAKN